LQAGTAATDQRHDGKQADDVGERAEQGVARTEHRARADNRCAREHLSDYQFALTARPNVRGTRPRIGADSGDEHEPRYAGSRRLLRERAGAFDMD